MKTGVSSLETQVNAATANTFSLFDMIRCVLPLTVIYIFLGLGTVQKV
jgi:hypothetical protein